MSAWRCVGHAGLQGVADIPRALRRLCISAFRFHVEIWMVEQKGRPHSTVH